MSEPTTEPTDDELDLDAIDALAKRQAAGYARMLELDGGIGLLGVKEPSLYEGMLEWANATENDHADTVIALVAEVKRLGAALAVALEPSDDDLRAAEQLDTLSRLLYDEGWGQHYIDAVTYAARALGRKAQCKHENTHMRGWTQVCDDCGQGREIR